MPLIFLFYVNFSWLIVLVFVIKNEETISPVSRNVEKSFQVGKWWKDPNLSYSNIHLIRVN